MTSSFTDFEKAVHNLTVRLLEEYRPLIHDLELFADYQGIRVVEPDPRQRCSELEVVFRRGRDIADIFEFFVEKEGQPNATIDEVEEWLRFQLVDLPKRHG